MSQQSAIYDLGDVDGSGTERQPAFASPVANRPSPPAFVAPAPSAPLDWVGSLSLFIPGSAQILGGHFSAGFCFLCCMTFLGTLAWALLDGLERLTATLGVLGYPTEFAVWALGAVYLAACLLHVLGVLTRSEDEEHGHRRVAPHAAIPAVASLLVPGWGQTLNGDRKRAALFVMGLWTVVAAWILASTPARELLDSHGFFLPRGLEVFTSPAVRWTLPPVIWTLAVYDAASSAAARR